MTHPSDTTLWQEAPPPAELPPEIGLDLRFPLRSSSSTAEPDLQKHTDDLNRWLVDHPDHQVRYAPAAAWLNYRVALTLATSGYTTLSLHYFETALIHQPDHSGCRINYAIALHSLKRENTAIQQYELVLPQLDPLTDGRIFHLAARLHARHGNPKRAQELLQQAAPAMPDDPSFWALYTELKPPADDSCSTVRASVSTKSGPPPIPKFCRQCGSSPGPNAKFCPQCGQPVHLS